MTNQSTPTETEDRERAGGRLFGLADAVFAIAMTLLALDLRVPDLGGHPADHALVRALLDQEPRYLAFLISFYVIAAYWMRHNAEMRTADPGSPALVRRTLPLLLAVCALPFAADLLGRPGGLSLPRPRSGDTGPAADPERGRGVGADPPAQGAGGGGEH